MSNQCDCDTWRTFVESLYLSLVYNVGNLPDFWACKVCAANIQPGDRSDVGHHGTCEVLSIARMLGLEVRATRDGRHFVGWVPGSGGARSAEGCSRSHGSCGCARGRTSGPH